MKKSHLKATDPSGEIWGGVDDTLTTIEFFRALDKVISK